MNEDESFTFEPDYLERWYQAGGSLHQFDKVTNPDYYKSIKGWFDFESVYDAAVSTAADDAVFVEIGCWDGKSTAYLASRVALARKQITVHAIDVWLGYRGTTPISKFTTFLNNMHRANVIDMIIPLRMMSSRAAKLFDDNSIDFCFLDAEHTYEAVIEDLRRWMPKIRPGGVFAGHDYSNEFAGVIRAVDEFFPKGSVQIMGRSWVTSKPLTP